MDGIKIFWLNLLIRIFFEITGILIDAIFRIKSRILISTKIIILPEF